MRKAHSGQNGKDQVRKEQQAAVSRPGRIVPEQSGENAEDSRNDHKINKEMTFHDYTMAVILPCGPAQGRRV